MIKKNKRGSSVNIFVKGHNANNNIEREIIIKNYLKKYKKQRTNLKLHIGTCKLQEPFCLLIFFLVVYFFLWKESFSETATMTFLLFQIIFSYFIVDG